MITEKRKATAATVAPKSNLPDVSYRNCPNKSSVERQEKIAERRVQIPKKFRGVYDRALKRGNLRAAVNAQCLECVMWVADEVRQCTDLACPLYVHRQLDGKYCPIDGYKPTNTAGK